MKIEGTVIDCNKPFISFLFLFFCGEGELSHFDMMESTA